MKLKQCLIRALHTFAQTVGSVLTLDSIMSGVSWSTIGKACLAGIIAALLSFCKSLIIGIPENNPI